VDVDLTRRFVFPNNGTNSHELVFRRNSHTTYVGSNYNPTLCLTPHLASPTNSLSSQLQLRFVGPDRGAIPPVGPRTRGHDRGRELDPKELIDYKQCANILAQEGKIAN